MTSGRCPLCATRSGSRVPVHHALWVAAASRQETQNEWSVLYTDALLASHVALL
jgi:hypothetical protein